MRIKVHVTPKARREHFEKTGESEFTATIKEPAERNEANSRVQQLVADYFNLPVTSVRFLAGMRSKVKTFDVIR